MPVQTLTEFARDLRVTATGTAMFRGREIARPSAEGYLLEPLTAGVYQYLYAHPDGNGEAAFQPGAPDDDLIRELDRANQVQSSDQEGWQIQAMLDGGAILARRQGMVRKVPAGQYVCAENHFPLRVGSEIRVIHLRGTWRAQPGFYHVFGADSCDIAEALHLVRLYFNVRLDQAAPFTRVLTGVLDRYRIAFNFKIATRIYDFSRVDTAVLYIPQRMFAPLMQVLRGVLPELLPMLDAQTPYFTRKIAPGIGFAEEPETKGSFGSVRSALVARALLASRDGESICPAQFHANFLSEVAAAGLDPKALHLRAGSIADYSAALQLMPTEPEETTP